MLALRGKMLILTRMDHGIRTSGLYSRALWRARAAEGLCHYRPLALLLLRLIRP